MPEQEYLNEARFWASRNEYGRAIDVLEQAVAIGEESCEICKELARLSLTVNEVRAFANWCHEAIRIDGADPEPYLMISRVLVETQRWAEAIESIEQAIGNARLSPEELREAEELLGRARQGYAEYKRTHPGASNL
jgi:tetratricopeptide (TPR) repeat protein